MVSGPEIVPDSPRLPGQGTPDVAVLCREARYLEWVFGLLGVHLQKPSCLQATYKRFVHVILFVCCLRVGYHIWRNVGLYIGVVSSFRRIPKTSLRVAKLPLGIFEYIGYIYLCYELWRNEKCLGDLYRSIRGQGLRRSPCVLPTAVAFSMSSVLGLAALKMARHYFFTEPWSKYVWHVHIAVIPLKLLWSFAVIFYLVVAIDLNEQISDLSKRIADLSSPAEDRRRLDLKEVCFTAFDEKVHVRARIRSMNAIFSKMLLFEYSKIVLYSLQIFFFGVRTGGSQKMEVVHSFYSLVFYSTEIILLSWAGTRIQTGFREAVDSFVERILLEEPHDMKMVGHIIWVLRFDPPRDALTIWDSFILARATIVTSLGGIVPFLAVILQFDSDFMNKINY